MIMHPQKGRKVVFLFCNHTLLCTLFLFVIGNFHDYSNGAFSLAAGSPVKFLPGFDDPLPFQLETGYIGVGESEDIQLFYYFVESERDPAKDPILIWLSGGPGCSSVFGLFYEIGPIQFVPVHYRGRFSKLVLNPNSWTKFASIIFLDQPAGTGFSYARNPIAPQYDVMQASEDVYEFIRKWLVDHPQFISNQVYIGGDSYSGQTVPVITQLISDGNDIGLEPKINLEGYVLGNPTNSLADGDYKPQFAHGMRLIPDELFESLKKNCRGIYHDVDPVNYLCLRDMQTLDENVANIQVEQILEPNCKTISIKKPSKLLGDTRILYEDTPVECRGYRYLILHQWANYENVQEAIHVRKGTIGEWIRCIARDKVPYTMTITNMVPYHANLSIKGYRSLIYSGDHDMRVTSFATEAWIKSLNYSIVDEWRPWTVDGQVGGYTRTYANKMTFATVKGGGHTAPENKPHECISMFGRWISYQPL